MVLALEKTTIYVEKRLKSIRKHGQEKLGFENSPFQALRDKA